MGHLDTLDISSPLDRALLEATNTQLYYIHRFPGAETAKLGITSISIHGLVSSKVGAAKPHMCF